MAHINLLPWREAALQVKQKEYFTILAAVGLFSFLVVFMVSVFYGAKIDGQNNRNNFLKNEIKILDIRIAEINTLKEKKIALQKRIDVIQELQRSRNVGTKVLDELVKVLPTGIYVTKIDKKQNVIHLTGQTESNNHLANMIRAIQLSEFFTDATPESISTDKDKTKFLSEFKMRITIKGLDSNGGSA
ncbi:MAG: PilN domain-containing protein [Colwellia sp.]